ncbi:hypothetical protein, partial [Nocardia cyriacigeorgica]|uniref:hypothetical protein n=1 Tax=Nocardia cyriacigeorgica TaxID=135487 RepID=UPI0024567900
MRRSPGQSMPAAPTSRPGRNTTTPSDRILREVADELGVGHTYRQTPVGVLFGGAGARPGQQVPDPFF